MADILEPMPTKAQLLAEYGLADDNEDDNGVSIPVKSREDTHMEPARIPTPQPEPFDAERAARAHGQLPAVAPQAKPAPTPPPIALDERGMIVPKDTSELHRLARNMMDSSVMHPSIRTVTQAMMAIQLAYSLNLNPYTACRQISIRNNSLCVHGDLELAMVRMSGKLQEIREFLFVETKDGKYQERSFENANADVEVLGAVCRVKRDDTWHEEMFTVTNAKRSKLWGKPGPWTLFSSRMLQMRARGLAMRNVFSDVTQGLDTVEYGHEGVER